ncbi:MAG: hypothetical protein HDS84_00715 [Bacteroidales bacterium]|nr:hypothetical protein [Bacteroidales bacterium]
MPFVPVMRRAICPVLGWIMRRVRRHVYGRGVPRLNVTAIFYTRCLLRRGTPRPYIRPVIGRNVGTWRAMSM